MEVDRVVADRDPQPAPARPASLAQRLHAPGGLVGMAQRRVVLVREDRVGHRLEQRHETGHAAGQGARRDRQSLVGQPCADALQRTQARIAFEQEARPDADPVGRVGEQSGHGGADTSTGDDAQSHVRRQRGRRITRLWALTSISIRVDSSAPLAA